MFMYDVKLNLKPAKPTNSQFPIPNSKFLIYNMYVALWEGYLYMVLV